MAILREKVKENLIAGRKDVCTSTKEKDLVGRQTNVHSPTILISQFTFPKERAKASDEVLDHLAAQPRPQGVILLEGVVRPHHVDLAQVDP